MSKIIKSVAWHSHPKIIAAPQPLVIESPPDLLTAEPPEQEEEIQTQENIAVQLAEAQAADILRQAAQEAERTLNEVNLQVEQIKKEAHNAGFQQGRAEGMQEGRKAGLSEVESQIAEACEQAKHIVADARQQSNEFLLSAERQIVEIALLIARKILKREIDENPTTILPIVKEALQKVADQDTVTLRVNPDDVEMLRYAQRDLQQMLGGDKQIAIVADHTVSPGGCMIDTNCGTVDASIDNQLLTVKQSLLGIVS